MSLLSETSFSVTIIGTSGVGITRFLSVLPTGMKPPTCRSKILDKPNLLEIQDQVLNQTLSFSLNENDEEYILSKYLLIAIIEWSQSRFVCFWSMTLLTKALLIL